MRHVFTHFRLRLAVRWARVPGLPGAAMAVDEAEAAMPSVFRKALRLARAAAAETR